MTSEGTGAVSLQAETPDSEVAKKIQPSPPPPPESAPSTSNDVPQLGTTEANECFYSDHMAIRAPINNSHQGYVPGAPEGGDGSMPNPSMQYNYAVEHQFGNTMISTLQIPPPGGRWNDILHTCGYDCYQSQSDCPKRQASSSGMNERQQKYTKTDLGSGQIVERCGFGPGRNERQQTKTRTDLGSSQIVERCGLGTSRPDGHQKDTRTDRVSRENLFVKRGCDKLGMLPTRGGRDSNRTGDGRGSSTFHRRWTYTRYANDIFRGKSNKPTEDSQLEFTVASYNVLAQNLLEDHLCLYVGCDDTALEWEYRSKNLLEEIKLHQPDILCMQEVNAIHYEEFFEPELKQLGYGGEFKKRTGRMMDGCATFFKTHKFQLRHCEPVEYSTRNVSVLNRDNVALLLLLCPVLQPALSLCVANTHLLFNPRRGDVKLAQLMVLLAKIDQLTYKGPSKPCTPVYDPCILCGDFNSMPDSELYKLLSGGQLNYEGLITRTLSGQEQSDPLDPYQNCMTNAVLPPSMFIADQCRYIGENDYRPYTQGQGVMSHRLNLQSVYKHVSKRGEKEVTTHHSLTNETVDYIFYSLAGPEVVPPEADASGPMPTEEGPLKLMGSLQLITAQEMDNSGTMPNRSLSSDHLILMAKFLWDLKYCSPAK